MTSIAMVAAFALLAPSQVDLPRGVTWLSKPAVDEQVAAEKFIVLVREPTGRGEWDFSPAIWEFVPGTKELVARVRFEKSDWSPGLLSLDCDFPFKDLIRQQVGAGGAGYTVKLFEIDYRTWDVQTLYEGPQAVEVSWHGDNVYLDVDGLRPTANGLRVLRHKTGVIEPVREAFRFVRPLRGGVGRYLVQRDHAPEGEYAIFDAAKETVITTCTLPKEAESFYSEVVFNEDLSTCAMHLYTDVAGVDFMQIGKWQYAESKVRVIAVGEGGGQEKQIPVGVFAAPGSGIMFSLSGPFLRFTANGLLRYESSEKPSGTVKDDQRSSKTYDFDPKTGTTALATGPESSAPTRNCPVPTIPENLRPLIRSSWPDDHDLALAFLQSKGIKFERPGAWCDTAARFSPDGKRFLLKMCRGGKEGVFFFGDLEKNVVVEIPSPESLKNANDMYVFCVSPR
jgi:hypothetical protein